MPLSASHQRLRDALSAAGWRIEQDSPYGTGPNPSRLTIRKGRVVRHALVYTWNITGEGKGRPKTDFRVQTTRSHDGDLRSPPAHLVMGLGWHEDYGVFGAFDVWIKRTTGKSSSVHLTRALLEAAAADDWAEHMREDGPTCAFKPDQVERYLAWLLRLAETRLVAADPLSYSVTGDQLSLRLDPWKDWQYFALRVGDHVALRRRGALLDDCIWKVDTVETDRQVTDGGSNRPFLNLTGRRHGIVRDASWFEDDLTRTS